MLHPLCPPRCPAEPTLACEVCERDFPLREARHAILDGPLGAFEVRVCADCYQNGLDDGIIQPVD